MRNLLAKVQRDLPPITCMFSVLVAIAAMSSLFKFSRGMATASRPMVLTSEKMQMLRTSIDSQNIAPDAVAQYWKFVHQNGIVGYVTDRIASQLNQFTDILDVKRDRKTLKFASVLEQASQDDLTEAMSVVTTKLRVDGFIEGWRDELLPVVTSYGQSPLFLIERAACPIFGVKAYGVHVNGYVRSANGKISKLWVGIRSKRKSTYPGMLDHIVAGGQPHGISLMENVLKECDEEASIPFDLAKNCLPVGAVSYTTTDSKENLKRDVIFCFDLELPETFQPTPSDGEVEAFLLKDIEWVVEKLGNDESPAYKPNCELVIIDFFIRYKSMLPLNKVLSILLASFIFVIGMELFHLNLQATWISFKSCGPANARSRILIPTSFSTSFFGMLFRETVYLLHVRYFTQEPRTVKCTESIVVGLCTERQPCAI